MREAPEVVPVTADYGADPAPAPIWDQIHSRIRQGKPAQAWWRIYIRRCLSPGHVDKPWPHETMSPEEAAALVTAAMTGQIDTRYTLPTRNRDGSPQTGEQP